MDLLVVGIAVPWVVVALGCWVGYQIVLQHDRILQRLQTLEEMLNDVPVPEIESGAAAAAASVGEGLAPGSAAPPFEMADLDGNRVSLEQLRGRRLLLVFFSPSCPFCQTMAPELASLPTDGSDGRPVPLVIARGDHEATRSLVIEHGIRCTVLLQEQGEVSAAYAVHGTPMGYLLDEQGLIATERVAGASALLNLADPDRVAAHGGSTFLGMPEPPLSESGDGLEVGTPAPVFRLPLLDGGELTLEDYRGRRVLLVFSDPHCKPCDVLAPELERLHQSASGLGVVMVSRSDPRANRAKVKEHGLTFPVALQRNWEISRLYRKAGVTPSGYLIDESGVIRADLAVGGDEILALAAGRDDSVNGKGGGARWLRRWATRLLFARSG